MDATLAGYHITTIPLQHRKFRPYRQATRQSPQVNNKNMKFFTPIVLITFLSGAAGKKVRAMCVDMHMFLTRSVSEPLLLLGHVSRGPHLFLLRVSLNY